MKQEMREVLENNILSFWINKMQDTENGGFYGQMKGDGTLVKDAPKGGILNARILWSFSAAYRVLGKPEYLMAATRAKDGDDARLVATKGVGGTKEVAGYTDGSCVEHTSNEALHSLYLIGTAASAVEMNMSNAGRRFDVC